MLYPTITEYIASLKDAEDYFANKTDLRPVYKEDGMIHFTSGNFAVVFKMQDCKTQKQYAVKCFIKDQERRAESYKLISEELQKISSPYFVPYEYLEDELFVDSDQSNETEFPVVVMEWVDGVTLDTYVKKLCLQDDKEKLNELYDQFYNLASWLQNQPFAHGDLKHDNILVQQNGKLVLVDYDGMYVPAMCGQNARELGSPDYRHPNRTIYDFNENIDFFPLVSIALSLKVLSIRPFLYKQYATNDRLLLTEKDFRDIESSEILNLISIIEDINLTKLYSSLVLCMNIPIDKVINRLKPFSSIINIDNTSPELSDDFINNYLIFCKNIVCSYTPLSIDQIDNFMGIDFGYLSLNTAPLWSEQLIQKYEYKWDWYRLSSNTALHWSEQLIQKFENKWNWDCLSSNTALQWSEQLIQKYENKWNWNCLSSNTALQWSEQLIQKYENKWDWGWDGLSSNTALQWSEQLIQKYKNKWNWDCLSSNTALQWSEQLIQKYENKWNWGWDGLSENDELSETDGLNENTAIPWSEQLIQKYENKWDWDRLIWNSSVYNQLFKNLSNTKLSKIIKS